MRFLLLIKRGFSVSQKGGIYIYILVFIDLAIINYALKYFFNFNPMSLIESEGVVSKVIYIGFLVMVIGEVLTLPKEV
jgi:hypothetical protein